MPPLNPQKKQKFENHKSKNKPRQNAKIYRSIVLHRQWLFALGVAIASFIDERRMDVNKRQTYVNERETDCNEQQTNSSGANQWIIAIPSLSWSTPLKNWLTNSQNSLSSSRILSFLDRGFGNRLNRPLVG